METFRSFDVGTKFVRRILKVKGWGWGKWKCWRQEDISGSPTFLATVQLRFKSLLATSNLFTAGHKTVSGLGGNCRNYWGGRNWSQVLLDFLWLFKGFACQSLGLDADVHPSSHPVRIQGVCNPAIWRDENFFCCFSSPWQNSHSIDTWICNSNGIDFGITNGRDFAICSPWKGIKVCTSALTNHPLHAWYLFPDYLLPSKILRIPVRTEFHVSFWLLCLLSVLNEAL